MEANHEITYASDAVLKTIHDLPEASELALDELRRDPLGFEDSGRITEIEQKYGQEVKGFFIFFGKVISENNTFLAIDFDPEVDQVVARDDTQELVVNALFNRYRNNFEPEDISPEKIVSLSHRANLLRALANLAIAERIASKPTRRIIMEQTEPKRNKHGANIIALRN